MLTPWKKNYDQPRQHIKKQRHHLQTKFCIVKAMIFLVVKYRCENWTIKKAVHQSWCLRTVVLEKTLESSLNSKEIKSVNPKGNQPWIFIGKTDAEVEAPILWPPDLKSWLIRKDSAVGKDRGQDKKGQQRIRWLDDIIDSEDIERKRKSEVAQTCLTLQPHGL